MIGNVSCLVLLDKAHIGNGVFCIVLFVVGHVSNVCPILRYKYIIML